MNNILKFSFAHLKPLKIYGQTEGTGVHLISSVSPNNIQVENPLQTLIAALAACELSTLKAISRKSNLKIGNVKFIKVESALDVDKFMKGGPQNKIEDVKIEAEIETNISQQQLNKWIEKALHSCPVYQMLKHAGVKVQSNWKNVQTLS